MANPPITGNTAGRNPVTNMTAPTPMSAPGATWLGRSPMATAAYPIVPGLMWQGKAQGRFSLIEAPGGDVRFARGPRMVPQIGTLDCWVTAPAVGNIQTFLSLGPVGHDPTSTDFMRLGVDAANDVLALIKDKDGATVDTILATIPPPLVEGRVYHLQMAWDAKQGNFAVAINGTLVAGAPAGPWAPAVPLEIILNKGPAPAWPGTIHLVQISSDYLL